MTNRWKSVLVLIVLAGFSSWILNWLDDDADSLGPAISHDPDYYMEHFNTLTMEEDGTPKNRLFADYMAHYPDDDTTELIKPRLEIFREEKPPILVTADKGWVTADNEVILLHGNVNLKKHNIDGVLELEVITSDARVLVDQEYAETDKEARLIAKRSVVDSIGMKAYFQESRLEFLNHVRTTIEAKKTN